VDLEDPVADLAVPVRPAHRLVAARRDVGLDVIARDLLVRELPQQVPGDGTAERPPVRLASPEVQEHDVVRGDHPVRRVVLVGLEGVRSGPHDPLVPVPADPEHLGGQVPDRVARLDLADTGGDDAARLDRGEQLGRLGLRVQ